MPGKFRIGRSVLAGRAKGDILMKAEDFEDLMDMCQIMLDENNKVTFTPWWRKDAKHIAEILKNNALENPSLEDFNALMQKHYPLYQARRKIKQ